MAARAAGPKGSGRMTRDKRDTRTCHPTQMTTPQTSRLTSHQYPRPLQALAFGHSHKEIGARLGRGDVFRRWWHGNLTYKLMFSYKKIKRNFLWEGFVAGIRTRFVGKCICSPPILPPHPWGSLQLSLAGTLICFAGCVICQDVMSSRPWKQLQCQQSAGTRG